MRYDPKNKSPIELRTYVIGLIQAAAISKIEHSKFPAEELGHELNETEYMLRTVQLRRGGELLVKLAELAEVSPFEFRHQLSTFGYAAGVVDAQLAWELDAIAGHLPERSAMGEAPTIPPPAPVHE